MSAKVRVSIAVSGIAIALALAAWASMDTARLESRQSQSAHARARGESEAASSVPRLSSEAPPTFNALGSPRNDTTSSVQNQLEAPAQLAIQNILLAPITIFSDGDERMRDLISHPEAIRTLAQALSQSTMEAQDAAGASQQIDLNIAALDALEAIARSSWAHEDEKAASVEEISRVIQTSVLSIMSEATRKRVIGDKRDALAALTRIDPVQGVEAYSHFKVGEQREFMGQAVMLGLIDLGLAPSDAYKYVLSIP